ncbi:zinc finger protein Eos isoform X3 [Takifugu flavidus]|uniref:zinc finger protein Eos isoform X3 n=1 Tax=Takifugu flavidus TaxID=433684 RepID=UPI00254477EA|nr:zinc finger protein Eos isoform X3 [Takifugu flavidus]
MEMSTCPSTQMAPGERMNAGDCNGRSYAQGNGGQASAEQDFSGGPSATSPNGQQSSPRHSLSVHSIKVELCSDDESPGGREHPRDGGRMEVGGDPVDAGPGRQKAAGCSELSSPNTASPGPIRLPNGKLQCEICGIVCTGPNVLMVHKRSHTGERPFQCNQCGASFTQKGNLLRHIKLHSGEKPFKCPICNYACRRRDALTGHLRTHAVPSQSVGKAFKCSYCSRSYKQQSTLEDHQERCHSYLKSRQAAVVRQAAPGALNMDGMNQSNEKIQQVDRLAMTIAKRKRTMPQKFLGEKHMEFELPEAPCELSSSSEKDEDLMSSRPAAAFPASSLHMDRSKKENHKPTPLSPLHPAFLLRTVLGNSNVLAQGPRAHGGGGSTALGREDQPCGLGHAASPNGCPDSTDTESTAEEQSTRAPAQISTSNSNHLHYQPRGLHHSHSTARSCQAKDPAWERACPVTPTLIKKGPSPLLSSRETVQVLDREGHPVRFFHCLHCHILFLDHVMFTIHMGCHGFHQPFECNICGYSSQDRYEFSSHISRGEHQVG